MRINKFLAENGIASRRHADEMVAAGRVKINGETASLGADVDEEDELVIDGQPLVRAEKKLEYYLMNKPKGVLSTVSDDRGRKTVMSLLPADAGRVFPVGRLDYSTEGLLLLTNDGDLSYRLTHPKSEIPKTYLARVEGTMTEKDLNRIRSGIELDGMFEAIGKNVDFLKRIRIGNLTISGLDRGEVRKLTDEEIVYLKNL